MATLRSLNVGLPKDVSWHDRTVYTGVFKAPVDGPRMVRRLNVDGDGQGDLGGHGGEQRAVLVYQLDSYAHWRRHFGRDDLTYGMFGENFTVDGLPDDEVCIGDRYRIGEAEFEVTQPRVTCYRVGLRMGEPELPSLLVAHHRPGFYLRVIKEGRVEAGDEIVRTRIGPEALSVADIDALLYLPDRDRSKLRRSLDIPALSPGWQQSFRELVDQYSAAPAAGLAPAPTLAPTAAWPGFRPLKVTAVVPESSTILSVCLQPEDGPGELPAAQPGQYLTLRIAAGLSPDGPPAVRSYSLSSAPGAAEYRISVKRDGLVSSYIHDHVAAGMTIEAAAPRGDFVLTDDASPVVLVSAGVGVTPVLAMLHALTTEQTSGMYSRPRPVWWIHVARDEAQQAFAGEASELLAALPLAHQRVFYTATGKRPTAAEFAELGLPADASAYICGPAGFMDEVQETLAGLGIARERIHTELFGALAAITPGITDHRAVPPHPPEGEPGSGPLITFARSGLSVPWSDQQASLLDLADACDVPTRWSCRTGVCHTCVTPLISGEVTYQPEPLEPPAAGQILPCCARPDGEVVLDL
ncbi:MOSC and FAD-binding oxidoreductase domain-containing protein [Streptomyces sp. SID13031]|uniref:MOSC and FAD-binding oxidoreductase domain-containing protein n=1 Tax=Streptomyces sp. SID13031 TaxID=2706046 RepID=UPI0013C87945|nr:MOSC and FAD-binding oxidoreductase domain-containing protein [Streptomyces sp. SID13031]NEA34950.1 MOSC domain-containing protein [Streptomyces sp. SID13031]